MAIILEAKDDLNQFILTDYERKLIYRLRVLLKDLPDDVLRTLNTLVEQNRGINIINTKLHFRNYINFFMPRKIIKISKKY